MPRVKQAPANNANHAWEDQHYWEADETDSDNDSDTDPGEQEGPAAGKMLADLLL